MKKTTLFFTGLFAVFALMFASCEKKSPDIEQERQEEITVSPKSIKSGEIITVTGNFEALLDEDPKDIALDFYGWHSDSQSSGRVELPFVVKSEITEITKSRITAVVNFELSYIDHVHIGIQLRGKPDSRYLIDHLEMVGIFPPILYSIDNYKARKGEIIRFVSGDFIDVDKSLVKIRFHGMEEWIPALETQNHEWHPQVAYAFFKVPKGAQTGYIDLVLDGHESAKSQVPFSILPSMPDLQQGVWGRRALFGAGFNYSADYDEYLSQSGIGENLSGASAFVVDNTAYVVGGHNYTPLGGDEFYNRLWQYDIDYDIWLPKADFPEESIAYAVAFVIDGKAYVGTGFNDGEENNVFYSYDPKSDTWEKKADFPGGKRAYAVGFSAGGKGYIGSGQNGNEFLNDFYAYDPKTDKWTQIQDIPNDRGMAYAFSLDGKGYVGGGRGATSVRHYDMYMYDAETDTWVSRTGIPSYSFTSSNVAVVGGNHAYVGLGYDHRESISYYSTKEIYKYSASTDTWQKIPDFASMPPDVGGRRTHSSGFFLNNTLFIGLGRVAGVDAMYSDFWGYKF